MDTRCRAIIDLSAAKQNYNILRAHLSPTTKMMCVVKANAYGHGAVEMAKLYQGMGADMLAVATAEEALTLRAAGIMLPCLVLGYASVTHLRTFVSSEIYPTIYSHESAEAWNRAAKECGLTMPCHIKSDTGMHRLGFETNEQYLQFKKRYLYLKPTGIYTHFPVADIDGGRERTMLQYKRFTKAADLFEAALDTPLLRHAANTAAILSHPETHGQMVRAGIGLYGYAPTPKHRAKLRPVMRFEARVVQVRDIRAGEPVGYGGAYMAPRTMRMAVIAAGYADGIRRDGAQHSMVATIGGSTCPLVGRVCMDACMADISCAQQNVHVGDPAVFFGGDPFDGADELARKLRTIPYEVLTSVGARVVRVYK